MPKEIPVHCSYDKMVKIDDLHGHPLNPNMHPEDQIKKLSRMIKYFGWRKAVTVSKLSGHIIRGHGRFEAAREVGLKTIPVNYQDYDNEDQELADLAADNKVAEGSELDDVLLEEIMGGLVGEGFDLNLTGFDMGDFENGPGTGSEGAGNLEKSDNLVSLPYIFKKTEKDRIMKILNKADDPALRLLEICKGVK
jgi:ParB-like chromosome segregation protein Spo0J